MNNQDTSSERRPAPFARPLLAAALAATAIGAPAQSSAADIFLKLDGILGESTSKDHKGDIEVISFGDGFSLASGAGAAAGRAAGKAVCDGITLNKYVDAASVKLLDALFTGQAIKTGKLSVDTAGESAYTAYTIEFGNALVTQVKQASNSDGLLLESLTLQPSTYKFTYTPQAATGRPGTPIVSSGSC